MGLTLKIETRLLTINPASSQPAEGEHNVVEDDERDRSPIRGCCRVCHRGQAHVDDHAHAAAESTPEHHGAATELLNEPDGREGGDCEDGVHDTR